MNIFGFKVTKIGEERPDLKPQRFVDPVNDDGAAVVNGGGYFGTYVDIGGLAKNEAELITKYRELAAKPEVDNAIEEIVNEAITNDDDEGVVKLNLDKTENLSNALKEKINDEFISILGLLDFNSNAHDIFRRWYIDGRLYYQKVIDPKTPKKGIQEVRYIDPKKIKKVRELKKEKLPSGVEVIAKIDEYFIYSEKKANQLTQQTEGLKLAPDSVCYVTSGLVDLDRNLVLSYLDKAMKTANQLGMMEDSLVIYRLARAPERRIFYIDVGNLPKIKAEQYLKDIMTRYRNKITYDSSTGEIKDDRKVMSMLEDFWLPRREGGRGTEISTLPGGDNLGQIDDVTHFQDKLYNSLNVPVSRLQPNDTIQFGNNAEVSRDEIKFSKFVDRLRNKFADLFRDLLKTQLLLKGIITEQDWEDLKEDIKYVFTREEYFEEAKRLELLRHRIDILNMANPYAGLYFSKEFVMKKILQMDDDQMKEILDQISKEGTGEVDTVTAPQQQNNQSQ